MIGKISIYILIIFTIIGATLYYFINTNVSNHDSTASNTSKIIAETFVKNYTFNKNLTYQFEIQKQYPTFQIVKENITEIKAVNKISKFFNISINSELQYRMEGKYYHYSINDSYYDYYLDNTFFYFNTTNNSYYLAEEISNSTILFNSTSIIKIAEEYLQDMFKVNLSDYSYKGLYSWNKTNSSGEYLEYYIIYYVKEEMELPIYGAPFGSIYIGISPNGKIVTLRYYNPKYEFLQNQTISNINSTLLYVDRNFEQFFKINENSPIKYSLEKIEIAYGIEENRMVVGKILYFSDNLSKINTIIFITKE